MSFLPVLEYFAAIIIGGLIYYIADPIVNTLIVYGTAGMVKTFLLWMWHIAPPAIIFLGGIWLLMKMQKGEYNEVY